jgi:hypothetical protein
MCVSIGTCRGDGVGASNNNFRVERIPKAPFDQKAGCNSEGKVNWKSGIMNVEAVLGNKRSVLHSICGQEGLVM